MRQPNGEVMRAPGIGERRLLSGESSPALPRLGESFNAGVSAAVALSAAALLLKAIQKPSAAITPAGRKNFANACTSMSRSVLVPGPVAGIWIGAEDAMRLYGRIVCVRHP